MHSRQERGPFTFSAATCKFADILAGTVLLELGRSRQEGGERGLQGAAQVTRRVVKVLQQHLSREWVLPSVGSVVGVAAVTALARVAISCGNAAAIAPRWTPRGGRTPGLGARRLHGHRSQTRA